VGPVRTRTAPAATASPQVLRFAFASCQNYTQGFYTAHAALAKEDLHAVVFLGDYIYEGDARGDRVRDYPRRGWAFSLADYRDRWLMLVFYPRDFSLVCPTELTALSARMEEFRRRGCDILGISTDSIESHERWIATPRTQGGLGEIHFPLASDRDGSVARAYNVYLEPQHVALRGLFIIVLFTSSITYVVTALAFHVSHAALLAAAVGIPLGVFIGWNRLVARVVDPSIQLLRPVPITAWLPFAIAVFGIYDASALFLIGLGAFYPIVVNTTHGVRDTNLVLLRAARMLGAGPATVLTKVVFRSALPAVFTGLRLGIGVAWTAVIVAEMIAVNSGLGFLILDARNAGNRYDLVVAGMLLVGGIGLALDVAMRQLEKLKTPRWGYANNARAQTYRHVERRRRSR